MRRIIYSLSLCLLLAACTVVPPLATPQQLLTFTPTPAQIAPLGVESFTSIKEIHALAWHDGYLWAGTSGGVVRFDPSAGSHVQFVTADGLVDNNVNAIAADKDGSVWVGIPEGVSHHTPGGNPEWRTFTTADGLAYYHVHAIAVGMDDSVWFGTSGGVSHYMPGGSPEWKTFTATDGLASNSITAIAIDTDGSVWFGTEGGVSHWK